MGQGSAFVCLVAVKLISKIVSRRLNRYFVEAASDKQSSKLGSGCAGGTCVLKASASLLREHSQESHIIFVDLEKACNTVHQELVNLLLADFNIGAEGMGCF